VVLAVLVVLVVSTCAGGLAERVVGLAPVSVTRDFTIVRRGLFIFAGLAFWDNLSGPLHLPLHRVEPFGFVAFLGALGYVAARQTLERDQQLGEIQKELRLPGVFSSRFCPRSSLFREISGWQRVTFR